MTGYMNQSQRDDWKTPPQVFNPMNDRFNFTIDAAASSSNTLLPRYWSIYDNALLQDWSGERVWCNPPYGRDQIPFIRKAFERQADVSVLLIPSRTDTKVWHECILNGGANEIIFIRGRVKFVGANQSAPFPSALVIWRKPQLDVLRV